VRRAAAAALAFLLVAIAGCSNGGSAGIAPSSNKHVLVIGDSNVFISTKEIDQQLRDGGFEPVVQGIPGFGVKDYPEYWSTSIPELVKEHPAVVVVALDTNDSFLPRTIAKFDENFDAIMQAIGRREVIWITHVDHRIGPTPNGPAELNEKIRAATARWKNLVILDMTPFIEAHPNVIGVDTLHFTPYGIEQYAKKIRKKVEQVYDDCGGKVTAGCVTSR
jgi:hypothetical protein